MRSASFAGTPVAPIDPAFEHIHKPGGFRRNYVLLKANQQGTEEPRMLNHFIDFLFIFGHFVRLLFCVHSIFILKYRSQAGEDLEEDEDDDRVADEEAEAGALVRPEVSEHQPLLGGSKLSRSMSRSRRRRMSVTEHGDATVTEAVLMVMISINYSEHR